MPLLSTVFRRSVPQAAPSNEFPTDSWAILLAHIQQLRQKGETRSKRDTQGYYAALRDVEHWVKHRNENCTHYCDQVKTIRLKRALNRIFIAREHSRHSYESRRQRYLDEAQREEFAWPIRVSEVEYSYEPFDSTGGGA